MSSSESGPPGAGSEPPVAARVAALVHDLRNPVNTIAMNCELIAAIVGDEAKGELGDGLAALGRATEELDRGLAELDVCVRTLRDG